MQRAREQLAEAHGIIARAEAALARVDRRPTHFPEVYRAVALGEATKAVWGALAELQALQRDA
jgi:hypothetical protein